MSVYLSSNKSALIYDVLWPEIMKIYRWPYKM